jgi:hypothetical protein
MHTSKLSVAGLCIAFVGCVVTQVEQICGPSRSQKCRLSHLAEGKSWNERHRHIFVVANNSHFPGQGSSSNGTLHFTWKCCCCWCLAARILLKHSHRFLIAQINTPVLASFSPPTHLLSFIPITRTLTRLLPPRCLSAAKAPPRQMRLIRSRKESRTSTISSPTASPSRARFE